MCVYEREREGGRRERDTERKRERETAYSIKGEGVLQMEREDWSEERGVLQLTQHADTEEHRRTRQMEGRTR